jgi:N-acetylglucosaminyldiphosphoundecaprenol N-acetyl-beta-D-mannosaminyltransferase
VTTTSGEFDASVFTPAALPTQRLAERAAEETGASAAVRFPRRVIMGTPVDLVDNEAWVYCIGRWLADGTPGTAIGVNANLVNLVRRDLALSAAVHAAELTYADGQAVVWASRLLGWQVPERLPTTDMIHPLCALLVERGASVFLLGGEDGVAAAAASELTARYPGLQIAGHSHGYVAREQEADMVAQINASNAQVLLVGMGDPVQQMWVARNRDSLKATAVLTCGGLFNWVNGKQPRPPGWMISMGMEWAWRLAFEPRRLWRRYVVGNPQFLWHLAGAFIRGERRPMRKRPVSSPVTAAGALARIPRHRASDASERGPVRQEETSWN